MCVTNFKPIVGVGESDYNSVLDSFARSWIVGFARVIIVKPLHEKLPKLTLVVCRTCNCFDAQWVQRQWDVIDKLWMLDCHATIGPITGHASDGNSRRRQLMLFDYKIQGIHHFKINWDGWLLSVGIKDSGEVWGLQDQNYIHNSKKLVNPLDSSI